MQRGVWHQLGYNCQKVVAEQLETGNGTGVVVSPKNLGFDLAADYAEKYRGGGASILLDPEFYVPDSSTGQLRTYPTTAFRQSITALQTLSDHHLSGLASALEGENRAVGASGIVAPALPYEAARLDLCDLNAKLFQAAKAAGDAIGVPTYATVVIRRSITTQEIADAILSTITQLPADGWYYQFEFPDDERLPRSAQDVYRFCSIAISLACTDKPVLHACAGPLALLSFGTGATGAGISFWQNMWGFQLGRWEPSEAQGGGGDAPARFFSSELWGTIVHPDEVALLPESLRARVMTYSSYSQSLANAPHLRLKRWDGYKHLVHIVGATVGALAELNSSREAMNGAITRLASAMSLHTKIRNAGLQLKDETDQYQPAWSSAATRMLTDNAADYEYLAMLGR